MARIFTSKKAQGSEEGVIIPSKMALYFVLAIAVPLIGLFLASLVAQYRAQVNTYLDDVEDVVLESRFTNSPDCFAYADKVTGRAYPGVIDLDKFTQDRMDYCYDVSSDAENGCFRLELKRLDNDASIAKLESRNWAKCLFQQTERNSRFVTIKGGVPAVLFIDSLKK